MNQSIGANSFEKSLLEKCSDGWQQESANELWKEEGTFPTGSFSSVCSQTAGQNTNQVYENLLRICEEIDTALPDIRSTVNKNGELHINELDEQKGPLGDESLEDVFAHNVAFEDIGTSLEDIEIYEDILNASAMMDNDDCIYNQNFDIMKTNKFLQSETFSDFLTLPLPDSMQRTQTRNTNQFESTAASIFDRSPIFANEDIDQYMATKNFNFNITDHFSTSLDKPPGRDEDTAVDPLQFWHKLNCGKLPELCTSKQSPSMIEPETPDESKKSTKSVLAIFDFTLPSLSSSASSCALSSPEQKDIEIEPTVSKTLPTQTSSSNVSKENYQSSLPVLVAESDADFETVKKSAKKKKKKRSKRNRKNTLDLLKQDLVLSSPSSSESSLVSISDIKSVKKRKLNLEPTHQKSTSIELPKHPSEIKPPTKNKHKPKPSQESPSDPTSPTLSAGAIYIEQQLGVISGQKPPKKQPKAESGSIDKRQKHISKASTPQPSENSSKRKRNEKQDSKTNKTSNNSTPKSSKNKSKTPEDKKRSQNSSLASMPSLKSDSSSTSLPSRIKKDENNNNLKSSQNPAPGAKPAKTKSKAKPRR